MAGRTQKRIALLVGVPVVLVAGVAGAYMFKDMHRKNKMETSLREGTAAFQAGDYNATMEKLGYYVSQKRDNVDALMMQAKARMSVPLENRRHITDAIPYAKGAADVSPSDPRPLELLLDLYTKVGWSTETLSTAERLLLIDPKHNEALRTKAVVLGFSGKWDEAIQIGKARVAAYPDDIDGYKDVAAMMAKVNAGKEEIVAYLGEVSATKPNEPRLVVMHAAAYANQGDNTNCVVLAKKAAAMPMTSGVAAREVLSLLDVLGRIDSTLAIAAEDLIEREIKGPHAAEVAVVAAERAWKQGRSTEGLKFVSQAYDPKALDKASDDALGWAAFLTRGANSTEEQAAIAPLTAELKGRKSDPAKFWDHLIQAHQLIMAGKPQEARSPLSTARVYKPGSDLASFLEADVSHRVGEWRQAAATLQMLVREEPTWRTARATLVNVLLQNNDIGGAVHEAEAAIRARQGPAELTMLARSYARLVESDQADPEKLGTISQFADQLAKSTAADNELQSLAARMFIAVGRQKDGETIVRTLLQKTPPPDSSILTALAASLRKRNPSLSEEILAKAAAEADTPELALQSALRLVDAGKRDEGRQVLEKALERNKGARELDYAVRLAMFLDYVKDPAAIQLFTKLADENPTNAWIQTAVLESECAWREEKNVTPPIERLRSLSGNAGTSWRLHEGRRLLTFNPGQQKASEVVTLAAFVLKNDPRNGMALGLQAEAQLLLGDRGSAVDLLSQAVDADADRSTFYPRLIELLQQSGRTEDATRRLTAFSKLVKLTPEMTRRRARLLASQGLWDLAEVDYKALMASGSIEDRYAHAAVLYRKGDIAGARKAMDDLSAAKDLPEAVTVQIADFYATQGDVNRGREILEQKLPATSNSQRSLILASYFDRHDQLELAEQHYIEQAKDNKPDSIAELAAFYFKRGREEPARVALDRGLKIDPENSRLKQINAFLSLGKGENTSKAMAEIVESMNSSSPQLQKLAQIINDSGQDPKMVAEYTTKLEALTREYPGFYPGWRFLVDARLRRGQMREAADAARTAVKSLPIDPQPAKLATEVLVNSGQLADALAMSNTWAERMGAESYEPDVARAAILSMLGKFPEALQTLERWKSRIEATAATNPGPLAQYAEVLAALNREPEAKALVWPSLENPATADRWAPLALRIAERLSPPAQDAWLAKLEPLLIRQNATRVELGRVLYSAATSRPDPALFGKAVEVLRPALDDTATRAIAARFAAGCEEGRGNRPEAIRMYRIALEQTPDDPALLNNLAYMVTFTEGGAPEAAKLATRAVEIADRSVSVPALRRAFLETQGVCLFRNGQHREAEAAFRKALSIDANAIEAIVGLAESLEAQGKGDDARTQLLRVPSDGSKPLSPELDARIKALREKLK